MNKWEEGFRGYLSDFLITLDFDALSPLKVYVECLSLAKILYKRTDCSS